MVRDGKEIKNRVKKGLKNSTRFQDRMRYVEAVRKGLDRSSVGRLWCADCKANYSPRSAKSATVQGPSLIRTLSNRKAAVRGAEACSKRKAGEGNAYKMRVMRELLDKIQMLLLLVAVG
jgi:hypothetical protein